MCSTCSLMLSCGPPQVPRQVAGLQRCLQTQMGRAVGGGALKGCSAHAEAAAHLCIWGTAAAHLAQQPDCAGVQGGGAWSSTWPPNGRWAVCMFGRQRTCVQEWLYACFWNTGVAVQLRAATIMQNCLCCLWPRAYVADVSIRFCDGCNIQRYLQHCTLQAPSCGHLDTLDSWTWMASQ